MGRYGIFSPNAGKCGKNANQNNSDYGHFLRSEAEDFSVYDWLNISHCIKGGRKVQKLKFARRTCRFETIFDN